MNASERPIAPFDFLQLVCVALIWGVNNVAAKVALHELPPMLAVAARFVIVLALVGWKITPIPRAKWAVFALMLACVGPLHFGVQYVGLDMARDLAPMVVAMQLWAPASVLFAMLILKERASWLRLCGVGVSFAGVAAMAFDPVVFLQWQALALVATAACLYGLGAVMVRSIGAVADVWSMQAWIAVSAAPVMAIATSAFEPGSFASGLHASAVAWGCVVFGAVASAIVANALIFRLMQRYEVSRTTPYFLATPVISFTLAALVLGDEITPRILAGALVTMSGVALVALAERRFKAVAAAPGEP